MRKPESPPTSPFRALAEVKDAAFRMLALQRDLFLLNTEIRAVQEIKQTSYGVASLFMLRTLVFLSLFWVAMGLREAGWPWWLIIIATVVVLGGASGILAWLAWLSGKSKHEAHPSHQRNKAA